MERWFLLFQEMQDSKPKFNIKMKSGDGYSLQWER